MKSLRQLLRRTPRSTSASGSPKRRASKRHRGETKRQLTTQALEQRQMLAGDVGESAHNSWNRFDVNQDFQLSPSDALGVINYLASDGAQAEQVSAEVDPFANRKVDVNGDGSVTPSDALGVINALSRGEAMDPLVELLLTARDADDNELPETDGIIEVGVGQENSFFLEVSYRDLRRFGADIGVFSIFPDIGLSQGGLLTPVMREAQQIVIDNDIAQSNSGGITLGIEGSSQTVDITLDQLADDALTALSDALVTFGYETSEFTITEPSFLKGDEPIKNLGFEIRYVAPEFGNIDIPDLTITETFDNDVDTSFAEISPINASGGLNFDALSVSLDVRSRTLNDNEKFYTSLNRGSFDTTNGFSDIGGVGPLVGEGIPAVSDDPYDGKVPFDSFSVEVYVNSPISNSNPLVADVNPGEGVDPLTLYGSDDGVVPDDLIEIDEDAFITISTGATSVNNPPVLGTTPLTATVSEDGDSTEVDLLEGATDADPGDTLSVTDFNFLSGDTSGLTLDGSKLTIDPSAYNALQEGATSVIIAEYTVTDGNAGSPTQNLTITINGVNDEPVVSAAISETRSENAPQFNIDLLQNASDPDSIPTADTLDAVSIVQNGNDDASGITVDDANNRLIVDPGAYSSLESGQSVTVTYDFMVSDGNGGMVASTATITINGDTPNQSPEVSGPETLEVSEDDSDTVLDLLGNASDPDGDTLTVSDLTRVSGDATGITENGNSLSVSPGDYNSLAVNESEVIVYSYNVVDGEGGSVAQSATITINGRNDAPITSGPVTETLNEDDASDTAVDLLSGASDPDNGDVVSVDAQTLTLVSGDDSGVTSDGSTLTVDPSAYNSLAAGESEVIVYTYDLIDGNGGVTAQSATITVTGANDAPVVGDPVSATFSEDDASASVDMLIGASDVDTNDTLTVTNINTVSGDSSPFNIVDDTTIQFDPNAYNSLAEGESEIVVLTYDVIDGNGGSAAQTATITINGANDAPVVDSPLVFTFNEDQGTQSASLLDGASDPDTSDTLTVTGVNVVGDDSGISRNGADLTIDTGAYGDLNTGEQAVITFTYSVTDGTENVSQTATVTIEGRDEGIPVVSEPITVVFDENDDSTAVDLLQGASDPDGDPLSVIDASVTSGDARGVTIDADNNRLLVNPSAYADLDDGEQEVVVVAYKITDDQGNTVDQTATVTINGQTIVLSSISGELFVDHIENIAEVRNGAEPIRNNIKEDDEEGLGSVTVQLKQITETGEVVVDSTLTDNEGNYNFDGLLPGTYVVEYLLPDSVQFTGSKRGVVEIGEQGGEDKSGPELHAFGLIGVAQRLDYLVKSYIAAGVFDTDVTSENLSGGTAVLRADGTQEMFVAEEGFDAKYAEVVLNASRDAALLTIIDADDVVKTARLSAEEFVVTKDGLGVRFFLGEEDYDFTVKPEDLIDGEFDKHRNLIDQAISQGV